MICAQLERLQLAVINSENANNKLSYNSGSEGGVPLTISLPPAIGFTLSRFSLTLQQFFGTS